LAEFEGLEREELLSKFKHKQELRRKEMDLVDWNDPVQVDKYYRENTFEIYDHLDWHFTGRRSFDKKLLEKIKTENPDRATEILDYGSGAGQVAYMLAKEKYIVTVADKNKKSYDFISYRFEKHRLKIKKLVMPIHLEFKNKYDIILCFDVLEHIPDSEFEATINQIKSMLKPNGRVFATVSFGAQDYHPSHFDMTEKKKKLIMDLVSDTVE
jgi:2-polyprenyl-3-methyl-5-hydroxy-6-metoxy-1,4-benzoquinol methylase